MKRTQQRVYIAILLLCIGVLFFCQHRFASKEQALTLRISQLEDELASLKHHFTQATETLNTVTDSLSTQTPSPVTSYTANATPPPQASATPLSTSLNEKTSAPLPTGPETNEIKANLSGIIADFDKLDANRDDTLNAQEYGAQAQRLEAFDLNHDGEIDRDEVEAVKNLMERSTRYAERHDKNNDGYPIEKESFEGNLREFAYIDRDQDQLLTEQEYYDFLLKSRDERRRFDVNQDGELTFDEFGGSKARFDSLDRDHDSKLDAWEIGYALARGKW